MRYDDIIEQIREEYSAKEFCQIDLEIEVAKRQGCGVILMRGKRKGEPCGKPVKYEQKENNYSYWVCGLHKTK